MLWHWLAIMHCRSLFPEGNVFRELAIYILLTVSVFNWYKEYKSKKKSEYETEIQYNNKYLCPSSSGKCGYRPNHPCPFLKATTREEKFFGDNLFRDWRYNPDGSLNKDFVLNNPIYGGESL